MPELRSRARNTTSRTVSTPRGPSRTTSQAARVRSTCAKIGPWSVETEPRHCSTTIVLIFVNEEVGAITDSFYRGENLLAQLDALLVGQHASAAEPYDRPIPVTERDHVVGRIDLYPWSPRPAFHDARHREAAGFGSDKPFLAAPASCARGAAALCALRAAHLLPSRFPARPPWDQLSASQALAN